MNRFILIACILAIITFAGCSSIRINIEQDPVKSTERVKLRHLGKVEGRNNPVIAMEQIIVKTSAKNQPPKYQCFDILTMPAKSFKLDSKVFMIIDEEVFEMNLLAIEFERMKTKTEQSKKDSSALTSVTEYSDDNKKITRFTYMLNQRIIEKIKGANHIHYQYYSGPDMIKVAIRDKALKNLKSIIKNENIQKKNPIISY